MQRQTLVPLAEHMAQRSPTGAGMKALEVGCGTGRFATFVKVGFQPLRPPCAARRVAREASTASLGFSRAFRGT